jgi:hypothetical protein
MRVARRALSLTVAIGIAMVAPASAQPTCADCSRGDALIDHFSLQPLRLIAAELAAVPLADPVTPIQYATLLELRHRQPELVRVGGLDDADLATVAAALCHVESGPCVDTTTRTLRCLADRCTVDLPVPGTDVADAHASCTDGRTMSRGRATANRRSPSYGLGFEWGTGWQRSQYPTDGRAWSLGIEGRLRLGSYLGAAVRVDRIISLDQATDTDGDGFDDMSTGPITRIATLAGPSIILDNTGFKNTTRFLRLDLLAGYISTRSQADESGPAAGFDLAYQLSVFRFGARLVQGFGDAGGATMVLAHLGIVSGALPAYRDKADCDAQPDSRSTRLALGLDIPLGGFGFDSLGYSAPGLGVELLWHLTSKLDALTHADLLVYPGYHRDRVIHQAVLAGLRLDHRRHARSEEHFFTALMAGYTEGSGVNASSGPVADLSVAWGGQGRAGAAHLRLHGRFGIGPDNLDYRAIFLSAGIELRLDPNRWNDRARD